MNTQTVLFPLLELLLQDTKRIATDKTQAMNFMQADVESAFKHIEHMRSVLP